MDLEVIVSTVVDEFESRGHDHVSWYTLSKPMSALCSWWGWEIAGRKDRGLFDTVENR